MDAIAAEDQVERARRATLVRDVLRTRPKGQSPATALRRLVASLDEETHAYARIDNLTVGWWRVVAASPSLEARLREVADEAAEGLAIALGGASPDGLARLVGGMIVLTWRTAHAEAFRVFERGGSSKKARVAFLALLARGFAGIDAIKLTGT